MKRKIFEKLTEWKMEYAGRTALLIDGTRRVGKSYIVTKFAQKNYKTYILIDFNKVGDDIKELFEKYLNDLDTFFMYLTPNKKKRKYLFFVRPSHNGATILHPNTKVFDFQGLFVFLGVKNIPNSPLHLFPDFLDSNLRLYRMNED